MKPKIQARIPNAMFLEIERAARHELISIADFVRAALLEKLKQEREGVRVSRDPVNFWMEQQRRAASKK
jgi:hypothetical protein